MRNQSITKRLLRAMILSRSERLRLILFVASQRTWTMRHAVPLETIVEQCLRAQGFHSIRFKQIEPHPVFEVTLHLGRVSPQTPAGVQTAVRLAFGHAGRAVKPDLAFAKVSGNWAKVTVLL